MSKTRGEVGKKGKELPSGIRLENLGLIFFFERH